MKKVLFVITLGFATNAMWSQEAPAPAESAPEPPTEEASRWSDFLPINKEMAGDADMPLPFGLGVTILNQKQSMKTDSISITVPNTVLDFVYFEPGLSIGAITDSTNLSIDADRVDTDVDVKLVKLDAWVLPFMNVYGIAGEIEGSNQVVNASVTAGQGESAAKNASNALKTNFPATVYDGDLVGMGVVLAFARDNWWATLDYSHTEADLSISASEITTKTFSPRVGTTGKLGDMSGVIWLGGMHQDVDEHQTGTSGVISYDVRQHAEEEWNLLIGGSVNLSEEMDFAIEAGVGGRESFMGTLTYRF